MMESFEFVCFPPVHRVFSSERRSNNRTGGKLVGRYPEVFVVDSQKLNGVGQRISEFALLGRINLFLKILEIEQDLGETGTRS